MSENNLDELARLIIFFAWVFVLSPCLGFALGARGYTKCVFLGAAMQWFIVLALGMFFAVLWAALRLFG
jgi:hypothetical protein